MGFRVGFGWLVVCWLFFFFFGFSANLNFILLCSVLCLGLFPKTVSQKIKRQFYYYTEELQKGI